jgi:hypothetical protein
MLHSRRAMAAGRVVTGRKADRLEKNRGLIGKADD